MHDERRMSDLEAMMWTVEKDPHLASTFGSITLFDRAPDLERFRARLHRAAALIPRLRQHVVPTLGRLAPPEWRDDPDFDIERHVRHLALPGEGTERELFDLAARFVLDPFDRTRPLWEFTIVEGLAGGRAALVQKMHHAITDGEGGIRMSEQFIDLERDGRDLDPVPWPEPGGAGVGVASLVETTSDVLGHTLRRSVGVARRAAEDAVDLLIHPSTAAHLAPEAVETARSAIRQLTVTDPAHSPLWAQRTLQRRFDRLDVDFDDARAAAKRLGGSLNDLFVAGAAAGIGAYHRELGTPVDELRMAMPISTRTDGSAGGNSFAPTRVLVPTGDLDPIERFEAVRERLAVTKAERAIGLVAATAGIANLLPTSVLVRFTRQQVETVDFATSNLRAAPIPLYMAGALVEATYPMGPLSGTACNLTMMSYAGMLNMGLHTDAGAVSDPELLVRHLIEAYAELIAAAS